MKFRTLGNGLVFRACTVSVVGMVLLAGCDGMAPQTPANQIIQGSVSFDSPANDMNLARGQTVLLRWSVQGVDSGTIRLFYDRDGQIDTGDEVYFEELPVQPQGAFDFDTAGLTFGLTYYFGVKLQLEGFESLWDYAPGKVSIGTPGLSNLTPTADQDIILGASVTVTWQGDNLPVGATCEVYVDGDRLVETGDEQVLATITVTQASDTYSVTLDTNALEENQNYNIGVRVVYLGHTMASAYAAGRIFIGSGSQYGLNVTAPSEDMEVRRGEQVTVRWQIVIVPDNGSITVSFTDLTDSSAADIEAVSGITPEIGLVDVDTSGLTVGHVYRIVAKLVQDGLDLVSDTAEGTLSIISAASITLDQPQGAFVARRGGADLQIAWTIADEEGTEKIDIFLDEDLDPNSGNELLLTNGADLDTSITSLNVPVDDPVFSSLTAGQTYYIGGRVKDQAGAAGQVLDADYADGTVNVLADYQGIYDLNEIVGSDPVLDGALFKGFTDADEAGWAVIGVDDYNGDGYSDVAMWARQSTPPGSPLAVGELFVLEGQASRYSGQYELNSIEGALPGQRIQGVVENGRDPVQANPADHPPEVLDRMFTIMDYSTDERPELALSSPAARAIDVSVAVAEGSPSPTAFTLASGNTSFLLHAAASNPAGVSLISMIDPVVTITSITVAWIDENMNERETTLSDVNIGISWPTDEQTGDYLPDPAPGTTLSIELSLPVLGPQEPTSADVEAALVVTFNVVATDQYAGSAFLFNSSQLAGETYGAGADAMQLLAGYTEPMWLYGFVDPAFAASGRIGDQIGSVWNFRGEEKPLVILSSPGVGHVYLVDMSSVSGNFLLPSEYENLAETDGFDLFGDPGLTNGHGLGDFNRDGWGDVICANPTAGGDAGVVYVVYGTTDVTTDKNEIDVRNLNTSVHTGLKLTGLAGTRLGQVVAPLLPRGMDDGEARGFDFNGDGSPDALFAAPGEDVGATDNGRIYILLGASIIDVPQYVADHTITADDPVVGTTLPGVMFTGPEIDDAAADMSLCVAGDVNADGYDDFLVVLPNANPIDLYPQLDPNVYDRPGAGVVYLVYGGASKDASHQSDDWWLFNLDNDTDANGNPDYEYTYSLLDVGRTIPGAVFLGRNAGDNLRSAAGAYDVDGDGVDDLVFGAPGADPDNREGAGEVYIVYGRSATGQANGQ